MDSRAAKIVVADTVPILIGVGLYVYLWQDYGLAREFCRQISAGMGPGAGASLARSELRRANLSVTETQIRVAFGSSSLCSCRIALRSSKVEDTSVWCAH